VGGERVESEGWRRKKLLSIGHAEEDEAESHAEEEF
jgi:hypothetical protein